MVSYDVKITAEDGSGNKLTFTEVIDYPQYDNSVSERFREPDAINQVRQRMPHLINVTATSSRRRF